MLCTSCHEEDTVRDVEFGMQIGLLVARLYFHKKGRMCPDCIRSTFWMYTLVTLVFGWWGIVSLVVNPFIIILNVLSYRAKFLSPAYPSTKYLPVVSCDVIKTLEPYRDEIFGRLLKGESMDQVSEDIGNRTGVTPQEVRAFYARN